jgi:hypothetical protein
LTEENAVKKPGSEISGRPTPEVDVKMEKQLKKRSVCIMKNGSNIP